MKYTGRTYFKRNIPRYTKPSAATLLPSSWRLCYLLAALLVLAVVFISLLFITSYHVLQDAHTHSSYSHVGTKRNNSNNLHDDVLFSSLERYYFDSKKYDEIRKLNRTNLRSFENAHRDATAYSLNESSVLLEYENDGGSKHKGQSLASRLASLLLSSHQPQPIISHVSTSMHNILIAAKEEASIKGAFTTYCQSELLDRNAHALKSRRNFIGNERFNHTARCLADAQLSNSSIYIYKVSIIWQYIVGNYFNCKWLF